MKRATIIGALLFLTIAPVKAEDQPAYEVARIAPGLRVNAPAVIRDDRILFEVFDRRRAEETHTVVYTIFRKEGRDFGMLELPYDRFSTIDDLSGGLYDEHGKEIRELSDSDVKDESNIDAYSLYEDARVRTGEMFHDIYPYTVAFTYRIVHNGYLSFPGWVAQPSSEPVEHTRFEVVLPADQSLRYWTSEDSLQPQITVREAHRHYVWEASGLPERTEEELTEDVELRSAVVRTAPREFELDGHAGVMTDWKTFGRWAAGLFGGKTLLPPEVAHEVDSLVLGAQGARERARLLYRYLQKKTRYVNITLGIGGWEPFNAAYVHQHGYGDCKALSNYMVALLSRAGIKAFPVLIYAGGSRSMTREEFPQSYFNHVVVCVPMAGDSVWLECTSKEAPFGYLGAFTENRPALLLTPEGGVLLHTPLTPSNGNVLHRGGHVVLTSTGGARAEFSIERGGNFGDDLRGVVTYGDARRREQWMLHELSVNGTAIHAWSVKGVEERSATVSLNMEVDMPYFGAASGSRLFFLPNLAQRNTMPPKDCKRRKSPLRIGFPFVTTDSIRFSLPARYTPEALPSPVQLDASFGQYRSSTTALNDTTLLHVRLLEVRTSVIPAARCQEYVKFMQEVVKADNAQAVVGRTR